jgi:hypothetical protein
MLSRKSTKVHYYKVLKLLGTAISKNNTNTLYVHGRVADPDLHYFGKLDPDPQNIE